MKENMKPAVMPETDFSRTTGMPMQYLYLKLIADPQMKPTRAQTQGFLGEYRLASLLAPLMRKGASLWNSINCGRPLGDIDHIITVVRPDTVDIVVMDSKALKNPLGTDNDGNGESLTPKLAKDASGRLEWLTEIIRREFAQKTPTSTWINGRLVRFTYYYVYTGLHQQEWNASLGESPWSSVWVSSVDKVVADLKSLISGSTEPIEELDQMLESRVVDNGSDIEEINERLINLSQHPKVRRMIDGYLVVEDHGGGDGIALLLNLDPYSHDLDFSNFAAQADTLAQVERILRGSWNDDPLEWVWVEGATLRYLMGLIEYLPSSDEE